MSAKRKKQKNRETDRDRIFHIVLYPENPAHMLAIMQLRQYHYKSVGILHNADIYTEDEKDNETGELKHRKGDLKKEHYHFRIQFNNPRYISGVAEELGIESNLIRFPEDWQNLKNYTEYILHWKESGKHQYDINDLVGSLAGEAKQKLIDMPATMQAGEIVDFIFSSDKYITLIEVTAFAREQGYHGCLLRNHSYFDKMIALHNERCCRRGV